MRIRFSSLASLATGPALSDFEMSFAGRNWPKIGKKLLQNDAPNAAPQSAGAPNAVVPLANQLVATTDSVLGPFSNQGGIGVYGAQQGRGRQQAWNLRLVRRSDATQSSFASCGTTRANT